MTAPIVRCILITNDDGINAPGLARLEKIARKLAEEVWVVAPEHDRSGAGQSISIHDPLRVYETGDKRYAVPALRRIVCSIPLPSGLVKRLRILCCLVSIAVPTSVTRCSIRVRLALCSALII